jgi:hypothetical protein
VAAGLCIEKSPREKVTFFIPAVTIEDKFLVSSLRYVWRVIVRFFQPAATRL